MASDYLSLAFLSGSHGYVVSWFGVSRGKDLSYTSGGICAIFVYSGASISGSLSTSDSVMRIVSSYVASLSVSTFRRLFPLDMVLGFLRALGGFLSPLPSWCTGWDKVSVISFSFPFV